MVKINELKKYWDNNIDKFLSIVESVEYQPKGIWYTEAFLFCSICDLLKVDAIIESGVAYGCSTDIFASYFDFDIISVDIDQYGTFENTKARLQRHKNLSMVKGNSLEIIPEILKDGDGVNVGVFIDGPKGTGAKNFRNNLSQFNNILCFGYHDYSKQNRIDIGEFDNSFITHEIDFITEKYSYLNDKVIKTVPKQAKHKNGPGVCVELV